MQQRVTLSNIKKGALEEHNLKSPTEAIIVVPEGKVWDSHIEVRDIEGTDRKIPVSKLSKKHIRVLPLLS